MNDVVSNFATRGSENTFVQVEDLQNGKYSSSIAGGTANGLTASIPSTFFVNGGDTFALRVPLLITPKYTNTGGCTLQLTVSGRLISNYPLYKGNKINLAAGDIVAGSPFMVVLILQTSALRWLAQKQRKGLLISICIMVPQNGLQQLRHMMRERLYIIMALIMYRWLITITPHRNGYYAVAVIHLSKSHTDRSYRRHKPQFNHHTSSA
ncbi:hypothetical protein [Budvicia aquatica]|uniref:Uncharacterized protein n=1 Tax=Budvicia aquatica TaxID=82979 RepID=A0A484ZVM3_9GAMM|nr:hypothetical protein [Budvicia aquatica]VFS51403.1 Uncharacterised protein [Budvicia aquatica]